MDKRKRRQYRTHDERFRFFSGFELLYWAVMASNPFFVLFLYEQGFSNTQVGLSLAVNAACGFVALPIWGLVADKIGSKRKTLMILFAGACITSMCTGFLTGSVLPTILFLGLNVSFRGSISSIVDSWVIYNANTPDALGRRFSYGPIRMYGSLGFALSGLLCYFLFDTLGVNVQFAFAISSAFALLCFSILLLHKEEYLAQNTQEVRLKLSELAPGRLFRNFYFFTFLFVYMLINVPNFFGLSYLSVLLEELGGAPVFTGVIGSVRALGEVPMLFLSKKILKKWGYVKTIFIVGSLLVLEQLCYVICSATWQVLALQLIHGLINGLIMGSAVGYIFSLVPRELSATAQTLSVSSCFIISVAGNLASGWVLDSLGIRMLYALCLFCAVLAIAIFALSLWIGKCARIKKIRP